MTKDANQGGGILSKFEAGLQRLSVESEKLRQVYGALVQNADAQFDAAQARMDRLRDELKKDLTPSERDSVEADYLQAVDDRHRARVVGMDARRREALFTRG